MRLNKFLSTSGVASRRKCDELIIQGKIKVNNLVVKELGTIIDEKKDIVEFDGKIIKLPLDFLYIKLNKPKGYICSAKDTKGRKTIFDLVKVDNVRLFNIGRLDYDTEGLLLLTNDGDFAQSIIHPSFEIEKEYYVTIQGHIKESELAVLRAGVVIDGEKLPKAKVKVINISKDNNQQIKTRLSVKIREGLNHQIRKMFQGIGKEIILLKRVSIGQIKLGGLSRGDYKKLSSKEMEILIKYKNTK